MAGSRPLLVAAIAGLALRVAFGLGYWVNQPLTRDEQEYLSLARSLASGRGFTYDAALAATDPFGRAPGYPAFLALTGGGRTPVPSVPASVKVAQAFAGAIGILLVAAIARRLSGDRAAIAAAWIAAVYPPLVWIAGYAFSEALFWPMGLGVAWLFDRVSAGTERGPWRLALACGLLAGASVLVRPGFLAFLPLAAGWLLLERRLAPALVFVLGAALVVAPWTVRNYRHHGRLVLVASEGGITFWTGNHPLARGEGDLAANPALKRANQALRADHPGLSEEQMEPIYYRSALSWIRQHPIEWIELEVKKAFYLIVPIGPSYRVHSTRYFVASIVSFAALAALAAAGAMRLRGAWTRTPGVWLAGLSAVALCLVFFPQERFRIPSLDPTLIICASVLWRRSAA